MYMNGFTYMHAFVSMYVCRHTRERGHTYIHIYAHADIVNGVRNTHDYGLMRYVRMHACNIQARFPRNASRESARKQARWGLRAVCVGKHVRVRLHVQICMYTW